MPSSSYLWMTRVLVLLLLSVGWVNHCRAEDGDTELTPIPDTERIPGTEINQPITAASRSVKPQPPPFVIGVWYQPPQNFALWKARGLNALFGYERESNTYSIDQWSAAAAAKQLWMIRQPRSNARQDRDQEYLLAWMQQDEPDVHGTPASRLASLYGQLKTVDSTRPVFVNVSGGNLLFNKTPHSTYVEYFGAADWVGNDLYPVTGWDQPTWLPRVGEAVDLCRQISKGKPQFAFIETSQQRLSWTPPRTPGVTPAQLSVEVWDSVIHGVKGIVYFPDQFNPFNYDGTPSAVSVEMTKDDALLAQLAPVLVNTSNAPAMTVAVNAPLEAAWRVAANGRAYVIALNLSPDHQANVSVKLTGFPTGTATVLNQGNRIVTFNSAGFTDSFAGYDYHIYTISPALPAIRR